MFRFWERRGHFQEGCAWLEQALASAAGAPARDRAQALNALANLWWRGGDAAHAEPIAAEALAVSRADGNTRGVAWALLNLGMSAYLRHAHDLAVERLEESVPFARQAGHLPLLSLALTFLGRALLWVNGPSDPRAAAVLEESLALAEAAQSRYATGHALATLGDVRLGAGRRRAGDPALAARCSRWARSSPARRGIAGCLERLAVVLAASDRLEAAAWLFGAAEAQHKVLGIELRDDEEVDHAHFVAVTHQHLGDAFATAWAAGQASTVDEAVVRGLGGTRGLSRANLALRQRVALIAPTPSLA